MATLKEQSVGELVSQVTFLNTSLLEKNKRIENKGRGGKPKNIALENVCSLNNPHPCSDQLRADRVSPSFAMDYRCWLVKLPVK